MGKRTELKGIRLISETGINFNKYRTQHMENKINSIIGIIARSRKTIFMYFITLLFILTGLCILFYMQKKSATGIAVFFICGVFLCASVGTALGAKRLSESAVKNTSVVIILMFDLLKELKHDLSGIYKNKPNYMVSVSDLLRGISYVVFIPTVNQVVKNKLKLFVKLVISITENTIFYFTKFLSIEIDKLSLIAGYNKNNVKFLIDNNAFDQTIDTFKEKIEPITDIVIKKVKIPANMLFAVTLIIGIPILFIIYLIM